jgi:HEAT repeat protein
MRRSLIYVLVLQCGLTFAGWAQVKEKLESTVPAGEGSYNGPGPLVTDRLAELHVPMTKASLISALHNQNPEIRELAASELAAQGARDAINDIVEALDTEPLEAVKMSMAVALADLGDDRGVQLLRQDCADSALPMMIRLKAANHALNLHEISCSQVVVQGLQDNEGAVRCLALSMIPRFKQLPASESAQLRSLLRASLSDPNPTVRFQASSTVRMLGDKSAIPLMEAAIAKETNSGVRSEMEDVLKTLQNKP